MIINNTIAGHSRIEAVFERRFKENPDGACLWWKGSWWTNRDLMDLTLACENQMRENGFSEGQRIAALAPNSPLVLALSLACWRLKGAFAPLNVRSGKENLRRTLSLLDVHAIVAPEEGTESFADLEVDGISPVACALDKPLPPYKSRTGQPETPSMCLVFSTSGTTGLPKAVPIYHTNTLDNVRGLMEVLPDLQPDSNLLNVLPNFHTLGYNVAGMLSLLGGMRQTILSNFVPVDKTLEAIRTAGVDVLVAVPTLLNFLVGGLEKVDQRLGTIRLIVCGGDRLNLQLDERCKTRLGAHIIEGYGLTECSPVVCVNRTYPTRKLGSVGPFLPRYEHRLLDGDGGAVPEGHDGVLWVRGPSVTSGYFRDAGQSQGRFQNEWFNTGDIVKVDKDGYVTILDRATDIIIVGGFNVYPQEVELVLNEHPAVLSSAVVGERNNITGEIVRAFVIFKEGLSATPKELALFCKDRLSHFKVPRKFEFLDEFPLSGSGKILRRELRKR